MNADFWSSHAHPLLLLLGLALVPRITLLFVGGPFSWLYWLGWTLTPHIVVAIIATSRYWDTDPLLCVVAWMFAFGGTSTEASAAKSRA